jgi:hypothetical protein
MTAAGEVLAVGELAAIEARLPVSGLFAAHARTDVTRLLAEVHRLHQLLPPADSCPAGEEGGRR